VDVVPEESKALAYSIWSIGSLKGPVFGAAIGGFVTQYLGWRWTNWLILIFAGFSFALLCCIKESYSPVILRRKLNEMRLKTGDERWWSRHEENMALSKRLRINLSRPLRKTFHEPIIILFNAYIGLIYGVLYLSFVAYPYVFHQIRGWTLGYSGLAFLGIGFGGLLTIMAEPLIKRMIQSHKPDPGTGSPPHDSLMSMGCIASVLIPTGQLWFSWTCLPTRVHWVWPILAGVPIGAGNIAVFIYATTHLANTYDLYAASALASNTVVRSVLGGVLPLIRSRLYQSLGANWASAFLGFLQIVIIPIPFVFYKYGDRIRKRSSLIANIREEKTRNALIHGSGG
jgi:MFS family permease